MSGFDVLGPAGAQKPYGIGNPYGADKLIGEGGVQETEGGSESFLSELNDALMEVRGLQVETRDKARALASGEPVEVHDLMISMGKSEVAFNLMLEVRNKLLDAWQILQRSVS